MTRNEFIAKIKSLFPHIKNEVFDKIEIYKAFLLQQNSKFNLTNFTSEDKIYLNYFYESIVVYDQKYFSKKINVLDIGSGSGIPGVLLKIFFPHINLTIIEANNKKCLFIKQLCMKLSIEINIINSRAELIKQDYVEYFDVVTSRAVAKLNVLLEIMSPYLKIKGLVIQPKSLNYQKELNQAKQIITLLNYELINIDYLTIASRTHVILYFLKKAKTPPNFPRLWKDIIK